MHSSAAGIFRPENKVFRTPQIRLRKLRHQAHSNPTIEEQSGPRPAAAPPAKSRPRQAGTMRAERGRGDESCADRTRPGAWPGLRGEGVEPRDALACRASHARRELSHGFVPAPGRASDPVRIGRPNGGRPGEFTRPDPWSDEEQLARLRRARGASPLSRCHRRFVVRVPASRRRGPVTCRCARRIGQQTDPDPRSRPWQYRGANSVRRGTKRGRHDDATGCVHRPLGRAKGRATTPSSAPSHTCGRARAPRVSSATAPPGVAPGEGRSSPGRLRAAPRPPPRHRTASLSPLPSRHDDSLVVRQPGFDCRSVRGRI